MLITSEYGIGYGWNPSALNIHLGDEVNFRWATPMSVKGIEIAPFTCADALSEDYDGRGFNVTPATSGLYKVSGRGCNDSESSL